MSQFADGVYDLFQVNQAFSTATTLALKAAPGLKKRIYVTKVITSCDVANELTLKSATTTKLGPLYFGDNDTQDLGDMILTCAENEALNLTIGQSQIGTCYVEGFIR